MGVAWGNVWDNRLVKGWLAQEIVVNEQKSGETVSEGQIKGLVVTSLYGHQRK